MKCEEEKEVRRCRRRMRNKMAVKVVGRISVMNQREAPLVSMETVRQAADPVLARLVPVIVFPSCPIYPAVTLSSSLADLAPAAFLLHPLIPSAIQISSSIVIIIYTERSR